MSTANEVLGTNKSTDNITPTPKRRGRKRKSEILAREIAEIVDISPIEETISRRGRPRKKVNYYELANPENVDFSAQLQKEVTFDLEDEETKSYKKKKNISELEDESEAYEIEEIDAEQSQYSNASRENQQEDCVGPPTNGNGENSPPINPSFDSTDTTHEPTTSTPITRDKRYNYTGETVKMMNTLFNLFANKTVDKSADSSCNGTNSSSNDNIVKKISNNGKRPYRKHKKVNIKDEDIDDGSGNVTCAICNSTFDKHLWSHHKQRYHNNLAWRVGDAPLDLNDQSFVMHTLNALYKKKKPLYCDKCGEVKKSVVGFLSHRSQCLKSEEQLESVKIACEICGRKMLPVSMTTHMKMHQPSVKEDIEEKPKNDFNKPLPSKRSAAKKAMKIIENVTKNDINEDTYFTSNLDLGSQEFAKELLQKELNENTLIDCKFNCKYTSKNVEDAVKHMEECPEKPSEGFVCKECLLVSKKLAEIIYHIQLVHDISVETDEDPTFSEKETKMPSFLYSIVRRTDKVLFPCAFKWTLKFCEENFSDHLFDDLAFSQSNWPLLPPETATTHLPTMNESCDVARIPIQSFVNPLNDDYSFKKYKLFESELHENKTTLFCGGPISSMAWLPTPYTKTIENQILAVSVLNSPDEKYVTNDNYEVASAIQFWNFGTLKSSQASLREPKLAFSIAHNHGPVWHMEWCPSGCYNFSEGKVNRMGLLAATGSDSIVYIYSVPFFNEEEMGLFYKPKPVMKLLLQRPGSALLGGHKYYPTRISWSKASGHRYVVVGYTNGFIGLFNIKNNSAILKYKDADGVTCILPNKCFQGHSHSITALALYHLNGGCRWLMSGSIDRGVSLWDLDNHNYPMCTTRKNIVTDGFWLTNWLCYVTAMDEGSTSMHVTAMLKQARDYVCDSNVSLTCSPSTISSISGSDWLNGVVHGNTVGEIVAIFPHQILQTPEHQKLFKSKRMLFGYTYLIEKNKSPAERTEEDEIRKRVLQNLMTKKLSAGVKLSKIKSDIDCSDLFLKEPLTYQEAEEKYALLFCDNKLKSYDDFVKTTAKQLTAFSKSYAVTHPNQYPLTTLNKIVFNPNRQASLYYATGYQAGFVRVSWLEFLKDDHQIK